MNRPAKVFALDRRGTVALFVLLFGFVGLYACGGGLIVGKVRERDGSARGALTSVQAFGLEPVTSVVSSDSGSPAWSPDSSRLVFAERYMGRLVVLDIASQLTSTAYEAGTAPATVGDARYNLEEPVFLDNRHILSGPSWGGSLTTSDSWTEVLKTDLDTNTSQPSGQFGSRPQVNRVTGELLLEASDGLRRIGADGKEVATYPRMYSARWSPDGEGFAALEYPDYYGENPSLVRVTGSGAVERLERLAFQPTWHPDGNGIAFIRPASGRTNFDPMWEFGSLVYHDLGSSASRAIADRARSPVFVPGTGMVVFEAQQGLGVSDLSETRVLREFVLARPTPSPDGNYLAGIVVRTGQGYYSSVEVKVYAIAAR